MRLHELRLSQTIRVLSAVEGLLGEVRARFRAKGIPTVDPRHLPPYRTSESTAIVGLAVGHVEPHPPDADDEVSTLICAYR